MTNTSKKKDTESAILGWNQETENNFLNGSLDDKPFSVLEKYVKARGESFNEWLSVWRAYTGVALQQIVERLYDLASTESEFMDVKWAASHSTLAELCDKSIESIRAGSKKIARNEKNAVKNEVSDFYRATERMVFHVKKILSSEDDIWGNPHLIGSMFSYAVVELSDFIQDNGKKINTFELISKNSTYVKKYQANMKLHLPNREAVDTHSLKVFYACLMSLTILGRIAYEGAKPKSIIVHQCNMIIKEIESCRPSLAKQMNKNASKSNQETTSSILLLRKEVIDLEKQKAKLELQKIKIMTPTELVQHLSKKKQIFLNINARLIKTRKWIEKTKLKVITKKIIVELSQAESRVRDDEQKADVVKNEIMNIQNSIDDYTPNPVDLESVEVRLSKISILIQRTKEEIKLLDSAKDKFNEKEGIFPSSHL